MMNNIQEIQEIFTVYAANIAQQRINIKSFLKFLYFVGGFMHLYAYMGEYTQGGGGKRGGENIRFIYKYCRQGRMIGGKIYKAKYEFSTNHFYSEENCYEKIRHRDGAEKCSRT